MGGTRSYSPIRPTVRYARQIYGISDPDAKQMRLF
jgi:hypothetical protein